MSVICKSKKNTKGYDKPNEDRFLCDRKNNIYAIFDGISRDKIHGKYPVPSPSSIVTEKVIIAVHEYILKSIDKYKNYCELLRDAMMEANDKMAGYNLKNEDDFAPGTVGVISLLLGNELYYAFIGDCYGMVISDAQKIYLPDAKQKKL